MAPIVSFSFHLFILVINQQIAASVTGQVADIKAAQCSYDETSLTITVSGGAGPYQYSVCSILISAMKNTK